LTPGTLPSRPLSLREEGKRNSTQPGRGSAGLGPALLTARARASRAHRTSRTIAWIDQARFMRGQNAGDLFEHFCEKVPLRDRFDHLAFAINHALTSSSGQPHIGVARLSGAIDDTAHHRDLDGGLHPGETLLDFAGNGEHVDLDAATGGTGDEGHASMT